MSARLCVLIDAENVPASLWPAILKHAGSLGAVTSWRVFADFSNNRQVKWIAIAQEHSLQPVMQLSGNNACDIAMTIAAMDAVHGGKVEGICIVSSDKDFTPLVHRLRSGGVKVFGMGEQKAPIALQRACSDFHLLKKPRAPVAAVPKAKAA